MIHTYGRMYYQWLNSFIHSAPTGVPQNFSATPGKTHVTFIWSSPTSAERNGIIIGYSLSYSPKAALIIPWVSAKFATDGLSVISGFRSSTEYNCSIFASNSAGNSPSSHLSVTTIDDSELHNNRATP